jgi:hypothetical protein
MDENTKAELNGIAALVAALEAMDAAARERTIRYLVDRYGIGVTSIFPDAYSYYR